MAGKPRPTLLMARALLKVAQLLTDQEAEHDGDRWRTHDAGHHLDCALRHLLAHQAGDTIDKSGHPHLVHAAARLLMAVEQSP